jgi:hypothetical protein
MPRIRTLFVLLTVIGPLHMGEQMLTSIEEFHSIRAVISRYHGLFDPSAVDHASVLLITIVWTVVSILFAAMLWEKPRLMVMGLFGLFAAAEVHHVAQFLAKGGYDPGVITSIPYAVVGCLLLAEVAREFKRLRPIITADAHYNHAAASAQ